MARRSDHTREELQDLIINTAVKILEDDGIDGLTARKLSAVIGYSPGTIYNVYKSMDDLLVAINALTLDMMYEELSTVTGISSDNPARSLKKMARIYLEFVERHKERWFILFTHRLPEGEILPEWFEQKIRNLFTPIEEITASLYCENETRKAKLAARTLWASVHGICFIEQAGKMPLVSDNNSSVKMVEFLIDNYVAGIRA